MPVSALGRFLPDPAYEGQSENDVEIDSHAPSEVAQLRALVAALTRHTRTPDDCYFCLWDGWGSDLEGDDGEQNRDAGHLHRQNGTPRRQRRIAPAFPSSVLQGSKVIVPNRSYFLFRGAGSDFDDWGAAELWPGQPRLHLPAAAFIWPADHAWCIANDVDPHWAGIGAEGSAIDRLLHDPQLNVVPADPRENQPSYR